jgi:hypothetical protein
VERQNKRRLKVGLAALAVLGIGAAATSALWSDDVWFRAGVETGVFNLQGSTAAGATPPTTGWVEGEAQGNADLVFTTADISPGTPAVFHGWVRNDPDSTYDANLIDAPVVVESGDAALTALLTETVTYDTGGTDPDDLAPGDAVGFTLTVTLDPDATAAVQGLAATIDVHFSGEQILPTAP